MGDPPYRLGARLASKHTIETPPRNDHFWSEPWRAKRLYEWLAGCHQQQRGATRAECAAARVLYMLLPLRIFAPHLATQPLPYSQGQAAHCELRCAARSPPADGHAARTGLPTDLTPWPPLPPTATGSSSTRPDGGVRGASPAQRLYRKGAVGSPV